MLWLLLFLNQLRKIKNIATGRGYRHEWDNDYLDPLPGEFRRFKLRTVS